MNKIMCCGDLHFGVKSFSHKIFALQMKYFEEQFFPFLLENEIKNVIQLGDIFDNREAIDWYIFNQLKLRFFGWFESNQIELHINLGNHDTVFKHSLEHNSLSETVKPFKYVHVYIEPTKVKIENYIFGFTPWVIDKSKFKLLDKVDIQIGHFEMMNFPVTKGNISKKGLDHSLFANNKLTLSGHFHLYNKLDNFIMLGTPYQITWNDFNSKKVFAVLDDNYNIEYIQNTINPQYVKFFYTNDEIEVLGLAPYSETPKSISKQDSLEIAKSNYCRLFVKAVDDQMKLDMYHNSLLSISLDDYKIEMITLSDIVESFDDSSFDLAFESGETTLQLITKSIEGMTFEANYDKDLLLELAKQEYKDAYDECLSIGTN